MIDLENRTLEMKGVFQHIARQHKATFSFDELQKGMCDGWREENDPSESWVTDPDLGGGDDLSARKGLAAGMGPKSWDRNERERKRSRLDIGTGKNEPRASSRTKPWLKMIWEIAPDGDPEQVERRTRCRQPA